MKEIYILLKERLATIQELKEVQWYLGQYDQNGEQALVVDTAAYIEFEPIEWMQMGQQIQQATVGFNVHFVQECVYGDDTRVVDTTLNHLELANQIFRTLQGWSGRLSDIPSLGIFPNSPTDKQIINTIVRTGSTSQHDLENLIVTVQRFQATCIDLNAVPQYQSILATLKITTEYE
jgi:hypothetical protein